MSTYIGSFDATDASGNPYQCEVFTDDTPNGGVFQKRVMCGDRMVSVYKERDKLISMIIYDRMGNEVTLTSDDPRHLALLDIQPNA